MGEAAARKPQNNVKEKQYVKHLQIEESVFFPYLT